MAPIHNAARNGNVTDVRELINSGANINERNHKGWTPLMTAAYKGRLPMVSELLNKGANINSRSNDGQTALLYAAFWGYLPVVKLLLNRGANINVRSGFGYNALMLAVISRNLELVRELLKRGANTNGVLNRNNIPANIRNAIIKHKAGLTIAKYKKTSNMRRRAASAKALNNVRTPNGRPLPPNAIRSIMSMLKPRSPQKMRV
jgi:ankyrin repeat protein